MRAPKRADAWEGVSILLEPRTVPGQGRPPRGLAERAHFSDGTAQDVLSGGKASSGQTRRMDTSKWLCSAFLQRPQAPSNVPVITPKSHRTPSGIVFGPRSGTPQEILFSFLNAHPLFWTFTARSTDLPPGDFWLIPNSELGAALTTMPDEEQGLSNSLPGNEWESRHTSKDVTLRPENRVPPAAHLSLLKMHAE